ncbi:MAG TPA: phospholipase D-like domain-containing protein [Candidatus Saccharimonadia bacterium]|nr:phospholipase D-like domain-containing protein [Candidatus Saccharimonadia bacterium]
MRIRKTHQGLTVQAIAGSHVVLLGFNMAREDCDGLLGFAIHRTDHQEEEANWLEGMKTFKETDPGFGPGNTYQTNHHPIQGFTWSDFTAKPGYKYTYKVQALTGTPASLQVKAEVSVDVTTESEEGGNHDIYFNRGASASQEYARRFKNKAPGDEYDPEDAKWAWLSRGAFEAILAFVARAKDETFALRVAAYEFRLAPFAQALREASAERDVDVRVVYDANDNPPEEDGSVFPRDKNHKTARDASIKSRCKDRLTRPEVKSPPISHNKFIVLLQDGSPKAVLTGSTNYSLGGVFGQANVVHVVEDDKVAASYLEYWELLNANTVHAELQEKLTSARDIPQGKPPVGTICIFSPRAEKDALQWYQDLAKGAEDALFMTFAFGMNKLLLDVYKNGTAGLRYALMEKLLRPGIKKEDKPAAEAEMIAMRKQVENRISVGNRLVTNALDRWTNEKLTGLNTNVMYVHTKFMLVDPLGDDPIVITGSANFSDASSDKNDENMLVIRRNKRVADIYLGEYMRLWNHYAFREWVAAQRKKAEEEGAEPSPETSEFKHLDATGRVWWKGYFGTTARSRQREYFSKAS